MKYTYRSLYIRRPNIRRFGRERGRIFGASAENVNEYSVFGQIPIRGTYKLIKWWSDSKRRDVSGVEGSIPCLVMSFIIAQTISHTYKYGSRRNSHNYLLTPIWTLYNFCNVHILKVPYLHNYIELLV